MRFVRMRLLGAVMIALIASGILSGALGASAQGVSDSQPAALNTEAAGAAQAKSDADSYGLAPIELRVEAEYVFSPGSNGVYAGYLFSEGEIEIDHAELYEGGSLIAYRTGGTKLFSVRLSAGTEYVLKIYGTGAGVVEIARDTLSRCYDQPLSIDAGGMYSKMIARAGDVHWYSVEAPEDGAMLISIAPEQRGVQLSAWLLDDSGRIIARSDDLESGASQLSARTEKNARYRVRVAAAAGQTGKYSVRIQCGADAPAADSVELSRKQVLIAGRSRASIAAGVAPADSSGLIAFSSADPEIAAVGPNGAIEGRSPGTTRVTAYAFGGARAECEVTVAEVAVSGLQISAERTKLEIGETLSLNVSLQPESATNRRITFMSSDESVATVDDRGQITAVGEGEARIIAIAEDGNFTSMLQIEVHPAGKKYRALLIGEQNYASTVETVRVGSERSVESMESLLKTARFAGEQCEVTTLMDQPRDRVIAGIRSAFADAAEQDVSILYITCHGFYRAGMTFFVMADGSVLSASDLEKELRAIPGDIVVLADCCGSGGLVGAASDQSRMIEGVTGVFQGAIGTTSLKTSKYHVLASALLDQDSHRISFSGADESGMATVFARAICDALGWSMDRGAQSAMNADTDYDGEITFDELYRYASKRVKWYLLLAGGYAQNVVAGAEGDEFVVFARTDAE